MQSSLSTYDTIQGKNSATCISKKVFSNVDCNFLTFKNYIVVITEYLIIMFLK